MSETYSIRPGDTSGFIVSAETTENGVFESRRVAKFNRESDALAFIGAVRVARHVARLADPDSRAAPIGAQDNACAECDGSIPEPGFRCAMHEAVATVAWLNGEAVKL